MERRYTMKKIISLILAICFVFLTTNCALHIVDSPKNVFNSPVLNMCSVSEFASKLESVNVNVDNAETYDICVMIELNDNLPSIDRTFNTASITVNSNDIDESLRAHRKKVKEYYVALNESAASKLELDNYNYYTSFYSPYIEIIFDNLEEYEHYENDIIESIKSSDVGVLSANSYATIDNIIDEATVDDDINYNARYLLNEAFYDIGVSNSPYTGDGVKVGIIDAGVPETTNLKTGKYTLINSSSHYHSTVIASIIGGTTGIAEDVDFYCMRKTNSLIADCNLMIDTYDVNIINVSLWYTKVGYYTNYDSYIDSFVSNTCCTFVKSAGNRSIDIYDTNGNITEYRDYLVTGPGCAMNAITVGSINKDDKISCFSSWLVTDDFLLKPDVVAPGEMLWGITNIPNVKYDDNNNGYEYYGHNGTSYAAPMVVGTIALLMEEFPELKTLPAWVKSIVHSGAEPLPSQTDYYDQKAGFGLINYEKMRECLLNSNYTNFAIPPNGAAGRTVCSRNVTIPYSHEIYISANSIIHSSNNVENTERATPQYTDYVIKIFDIGTSSCVATSTVDSSVDYLCFKNTNPSNTSFRIEVVLAEANVYPGAQMGAIAYEISPHAYSDDYTWLSDTQHCKSCDCGAYITGAHVVDPNGFPNPEGYATCLLCGGDVFMGVLNSLYVNTLPHTINGSYKLQNGVIVLVEEDMEAYLNGTLVFYTGEIQ